MIMWVSKQRGMVLLTVLLLMSILSLLLVAQLDSERLHFVLSRNIVIRQYASQRAQAALIAAKRSLAHQHVELPSGASYRIIRKVMVSHAVLYKVTASGEYQHFTIHLYAEYLQVLHKPLSLQKWWSDK